MAIIPEGFAQVNLRFTGTNVPTGAEIVFGVDQGADTPEEVADKVFAAWTTAEFDDLYINDMSMTSALVKNGPNETGPSGEFPATFPGTVTAEGAPPNVAMLWKKGTALGGRAGRGRIYMPGIQENVVTADGIIDPGFVASMQTAGAAFATELASESIPMVVLHGPDSPLSVPTLVTSITADNRIATQRRRLRR